jgi:hypothetical protein
MIALSTAAELSQLTRSDGDPSEAEVDDLRAWLTDELVHITSDWERPAGMLGITKGRVLATMRCPASVRAEVEPRVMNEALAVGTIVDVAASLLLMSDKVPDGAPWLGVVMSALRAGEPDVVDYVERLSAEARDDLRTQVQEKCELLVALLGDLRACEGTAQERFRVQLQAPGVQLTGRTDLVLGTVERSIVEVKSGRFRPQTNDELRFYALLAALRDRHAPIAVAAVTLDDRSITAHAVTVDLLEAAAQRVIDAAQVLVEVDRATVAGGWPTTVPGPLCGWCAAAPCCPDVPDISLAEFEAQTHEADFVDVETDEPW